MGKKEGETDRDRATKKHRGQLYVFLLFTKRTLLIAEHKNETTERLESTDKMKESQVEVDVGEISMAERKKK